jgi:hypothetical protein
MSMFKKFLASISNTMSDERKQAKDAFFIELTLDCEKLLKRTLTASELCVIYDLTDHQTEVLHKMISEANKR